MEELIHRKITFSTEFKVPVIYKNKQLDTDFRFDLFVENCFVVELKATNEIHPVFEAQLLTYINLLKAPKGILINLIALIFSRSVRKLLSTSISRSFHPPCKSMWLKFFSENPNAA
ncbi:MAG: hypothetical protein JWO32_849 [Bacteroidetes bacterium]|nr:hypothetical protein [Bacteroidota bacterium]